MVSEGIEEVLCIYQLVEAPISDPDDRFLCLAFRNSVKLQG